MKVTVCKDHKEQVTQAGDGIELGICSECGQTIQYDGSKAPVLTKLGRIGDKLVLPNPGYKLLLDPRDDQDLASVDKAPPVLGVVPPKPQTGGVHAVKQYYEEHKDAILHDLDTLGEKDMRKRWHNMSQVTFLGLIARWRPDYPGIPQWARDKTKRVRVKPAARTKTPQLGGSKGRTPMTMGSIETRVATIEAQLNDFRSAAQNGTKAIIEKLVLINDGVDNLINRGYIEEDLKIDIVQAFLRSRTAWEERALAKKILNVVQALENI